MLPSDVKVDAVIREFLDYTASKAGVFEDPPGSNRGPDIDAWADEFGEPRGLPWCARAVAHCRKKFGLWIPSRDRGSCDRWYLEAEREGLLVQSPVPGAAVLYGNGTTLASGPYRGRKDAVHIGTVLRTHPALLSWEGNTSIGSKYEREGVVLTLKAVEERRVLGYVLPRKLT